MFVLWNFGHFCRSNLGFGLDKTNQGQMERFVLRTEGILKKQKRIVSSVILNRVLASVVVACLCCGILATFAGAILVPGSTKQIKAKWSVLCFVRRGILKKQEWIVSSVILNRLPASVITACLCCEISATMVGAFLVAGTTEKNWKPHGKGY